MTEFGGLRTSAVEMRRASPHFVEERQVGGCWCSSRALGAVPRVIWMAAAVSLDAYPAPPEASSLEVPHPVIVVNQTVDFVRDIPHAKFNKPWVRWRFAQSIGQQRFQPKRLEAIVGTLGQVSNGVSVGQMFSALGHKARAKQSTSARAVQSVAVTDLSF